MSSIPKILDLDQLNDTFHLDAGELFRTGGRTNKAINSLKTFIYREDGSKEIFQTDRIKYAILNNVEMFDPLVQDDNGELVPVPSNIMTLLSMTKADKVWLHKDHTRGYTARLTTLGGQRLSKTFESYEDALEWQEKNTIKVWGRRLRKYNVYGKYFGVDCIKRTCAVDMPVAVGISVHGKKTRHSFWTPSEITKLRVMYAKGDKLEDMSEVLDRSYGSVQSKIFKLNRDGDM